VIQKAYRARVVLVSPSLLMLAIQVMQQILKDARMRDAADQIRTEVLNLGDDLGRLRDRVLKLQKHFGDANEDVRQILISADKIEKRAGRIEELDFSKSEPPAEAPRIVGTGSPDLFPPLVALASYCKGTTVIQGVSRLAHKESNRALTLQEEFGKMGVEIELQDDLMLIKGGNGVKGAAVHSHHDHRIAMACAVAALKASGETVISEAQAINKSYPDFYEHIAALGGVVSKGSLKV
jgi:molybdopterin converting factor small subunit